MSQHNNIQQNDSKHNDSKHNDRKHNDTQHNDIQHNDIQHNAIQHNDTQHNYIHRKVYVNMANVIIKIFMQLGFNEADTLKSSSILIYSTSEQSIYTQSW